MTDPLYTALAFDIGLKRTGVAVGQSLLKSGKPAGQIAVDRGRHDWKALDRVIAQWQPSMIVLGDPKTNDPALLKCINRFKSHIQQQHKLRIVEVDETLTSNAANAELHETGLTIERKIQLRDQIAACLILEGYFDTGRS